MPDPTSEEALDWISADKVVKVVDPDYDEEYLFLVNDARRSVVKMYGPTAHYVDIMNYSDCVEKLESGIYQEISLVVLPYGMVS